jgi:hypothetical protein
MRRRYIQYFKKTNNLMDKKRDIIRLNKIVNSQKSEQRMVRKNQAIHLDYFIRPNNRGTKSVISGI